MRHVGGVVVLFCPCQSLPAMEQAPSSPSPCCCEFCSGVTLAWCRTSAVPNKCSATRPREEGKGMLLPRPETNRNEPEQAEERVLSIMRSCRLSLFTRDAWPFIKAGVLKDSRARDGLAVKQDEKRKAARGFCCCRHLPVMFAAKPRSTLRPGLK